MQVKKPNRVRKLPNFRTNSWGRSKTLIYNAIKRESQVPPKAEGGLRIKLKKLNSKYSEFVVNEIVLPGQKLVLQGLDDFFLNASSPQEKESILGLKALTIDQLYAKGFTYGFTPSHIVDQGIISLVNDDSDFEDSWGKIKAREKSMIRQSLEEKILRFKTSHNHSVPKLDLVKALYRLPNNSRGGYPLRMNWRTKVTLHMAKQNGLRFAVTDDLFIDLRKWLRAEGGDTLDMKWEALVRRIRLKLSQIGITHESLKLDNENNNSKFLSIKAIVAYWLATEPNIKEQLLQSLSRMNNVISEFGNRYQGKIDKENIYNVTNITKVRTFIMFQLIMLLTSSVIRDYIQDHNAIHDPNHMLWRPTFDRDVNVHLNQNITRLKSIIGKKLTDHNVTKLDLLDDKTKGFYDKKQLEFLSQRKSEFTLISADYSKFDRHIPVEIQSFIFKEYAKIFSTFNYDDPEDKKFVVTVLEQQARLIENGIHVIVPFGLSTEQILSSVRKETDVDLALITLNYLLPSGMAFTSQMGSDISNSDMRYLSKLLRLKNFENLLLVTLGDDVLFALPTYIWTNYLDKVNHRTISKFFEERLLEYRHAEMNADKAVSTYNAGIILQTLVVPFNNIYGYYVPIRVNNTFAPERYQTRVEGIQNYASMQAVSLIMQWMNLFRGKGLDDSLYLKLIAMPLIRNRFMKSEMNLLKFIKLLPKLKTQVPSKHYWFFQLIQFSGGLEKASEYFFKVNKYFAHGSELIMTDILASLSRGVIEYEPLSKVIDALTQLADEIKVVPEDYDKIKSIYGVDDKEVVQSKVETIEQDEY